MQGNRPEKTPDYFDGDTYIQHNTGIADGLSGLGATLESLGKQGIQMIYTTVHQVLAQAIMRLQSARELSAEHLHLIMICGELKTAKLQNIGM